MSWPVTSREEISKGLRALLGLPNFKPKEFESLSCALGWFDEGMDFADALHLALSLRDTGFCTFDKALVNQRFDNCGQLECYDAVTDRVNQ